MEAMQSIGVGIGIGLLVIAVLAKFPGTPFAYEPGKETSAAPSKSTPMSVPTRPPEPVAAAAASDNADDNAVRRRILKLQAMLAEEQAPQAAETAATSDEPSFSQSTIRFCLGLAFYSVVIALVALALRASFGADLLALLAYLFPREASTLRQISAQFSQWTAWFGA